MSLLFFNRELDIWKPGQHTGTFRGNNLGFVSATVALDYWKNDVFSKDIFRKGAIHEKRLESLKEKYRQLSAEVRGRGFIYGFSVPQQEIAKEIADECFRNKLVLERAGARNNVIKFLAPLIIPDNALNDHDEHYLRASEDMRLLCVFNHPVTGTEVHLPDGSYPPAK